MMFRKKLLTFLRPSEKSIYNVYDQPGSKHLNRLRLGFSHLRGSKFRHNLADTANPLCSCAFETENRTFFLRCQNYVSFRTGLMNELSSINCEMYGDKMPNNK